MVVKSNHMAVAVASMELEERSNLTEEATALAVAVDGRSTAVVATMREELTCLADLGKVAVTTKGTVADVVMMMIVGTIATET